MTALRRILNRVVHHILQFNLILVLLLLLLVVVELLQLFLDCFGVHLEVYWWGGLGLEVHQLVFEGELVTWESDWLLWSALTGELLSVSLVQKITILSHSLSRSHVYWTKAGTGVSAVHR